MSDATLWNQYVTLEQKCIALKDQLAEALDTLRDATDFARHPDYDWPVEFERHVSAVLAKADRATANGRGSEHE